MAARPVSSQAISKRLEVLPAALVGQLCADVSARLHAPATLPHPSWEALIRVGPYRSNPWQPRRRMGAVLGQGVWSRALTKVLDPPGLSARQVGERYRRRWRIEAASALTKRRLALAYGWTGSTQVGPGPRYATLSF
jgi:hypothetical protein